jgi:hypothetical protein
MLAAVVDNTRPLLGAAIDARLGFECISLGASDLRLARRGSSVSIERHICKSIVYVPTLIASSSRSHPSA